MKKLFTVLCIASCLFSYCNGQTINSGEFDIQYTLDYSVYDSAKGFEGEKIDIKKALSDKFNYNELMGY